MSEHGPMTRAERREWQKGKRRAKGRRPRALSFTWEDVDVCRRAWVTEGHPLMLDLAERIAEFLPPRDS